MNQTKNRIREDKVAEHQTWIRENLWCKEHIFPKVDITCEECRKLMPLREKCDASFANSLNFIDELLKSQEQKLREDLVEKLEKYRETKYEHPEPSEVDWVCDDIIKIINK